MILVDSNLLVYAFVKGVPEHEPARQWLDVQLGTATRVGLAWSSLLGFVRLVSNPRIFPKPVPISSAWRQVQAWLDAESAWSPSPGPRYRELLGKALSTSGLRASDVPDAHLAALAIEHGLRLATSDTGFARFDTLTWFDPLRPN